MEDLLKLWKGAFFLTLSERGEAPTDLLCRLEDGDPEDFEAFFEQAYKDGRMTEKEWDFFKNQKPQKEELMRGARMMADIYHRLGLIAPLVEEGRA